jgi:hypothetical protein
MTALPGDCRDNGVDAGCIFACAWCAARLYRYGVLMYGQRAVQPGTTGEAGMDGLTTREGQDLSENETTAFYGIGLFQMAVMLTNQLP